MCRLNLVCLNILFLLSCRFVSAQVTAIHQIQGNGHKAIAGTFTINAIVTGVYKDLKPAGFYVQEEDADADTDSATSEGIFVISTIPVHEGDKVEVTGPVLESAAKPSYGQAVLTAVSCRILGSGYALPLAVALQLPFTADPERYEAMLVIFRDTLTVTDNHRLGSYGEVQLSAGGLCRQATQVIDPNDPLASETHASGHSNNGPVQAYKEASVQRSIILDDGRAGTSVLPFVNSDHTLRTGTAISGLRGIMAYRFDSYRILALPAAVPVFCPAPRPALPVFAAGTTIKAACFNLMNYFNGNGAGGGFPTLRGAQSPAEFKRQRDKILAALITINADILGLTEVENDGTGDTSAIADIVKGLNAHMGEGTYQFIYDGDERQDACSDPIRCAIIYKSGILDTLGPAHIGKDPVFNRPPLAQTFRHKASGLSFTYLVSHLKSKSCAGSKGPDKNQLDEQGCYNDTRRRQAAALARLIRDSLLLFSPYVLGMGDYNSYFEEDPLDTIRSSGLHVLGTPEAISYCFEGRAGALDHVVVNDALKPYVSAIAKWNINAAEPDYLNYKDAIDDGGSDQVNKWSDLYTPDPYRSSDHDPVLAGLSLGSTGWAADAPMPVYQIYPNPARQYLYLQSKKYLFWNISAITGETLLSGSGEHGISIPVSNLKPGLYLLHINSSNGWSRVEKWLKE